MKDKINVRQEIFVFILICRLVWEASLIITI